MDTIETKTKNGASVKIYITNNNAIKGVVQHPGGEIIGYGAWGTLQDRPGFVMRTKIKGKRTNVCLEIPAEDYAPIQEEIDRRETAEKKAAEKKKKENRERALAECPEDCVIARCLWTNGDLMNGKYQTEDGVEVIGSDMLECHYGWYFLPRKLVDEEKARHKEIADKKTEEKAKAEAEEKEVFKRASKTGEKQVLKTFPVDCSNPREECNTDIITIWAMPDGTKEETVIHTW